MVSVQTRGPVVHHGAQRLTGREFVDVELYHNADGMRRV